MYKAKKKFGQHFLNDESVFERILDYADLKENDKVWEVGAGLGALTDYLLRHKIDLTIFEIDNDLIPVLEKKYGQRCRIVHKDILKVDWEKEKMTGNTGILPAINNNIGNLQARCLRSQFKIITNLPFQISSPFLYKITENHNNIERVVVMLQKEVAKRVCAKPSSKDYGVLSLKTQFYFETEYLFEVSPDKFTPPPEVHSAVIRLTPRKDKPEIANIELFWQIIEASFRMKRKTLKNNLSSVSNKLSPIPYPLSPPIDLSRRGETLGEAEFIALYEYFLQFTNS